MAVDAGRAQTCPMSFTDAHLRGRLERQPVACSGAFADETSDLLDGETLIAYRRRRIAQDALAAADRRPRPQLQLAVPVPGRLLRALGLAASRPARPAAA
jgi:hypothetical protein